MKLYVSYYYTCQCTTRLKHNNTKNWVDKYNVLCMGNDLSVNLSFVLSVMFFGLQFRVLGSRAKV
jgi:hypothetical protein